MPSFLGKELNLLSKLKAKNCCISLLGSAVLAFGLYHIHSFSGVTEGGVLGLTLLLHHWFGISPALSGLVMNLACYYLGWRVIGGAFVGYSVVSGGAFSLFYWIFEQFPPLFPGIAETPLLASVLGALFVGVGVGLCVRIVVLLLSLSYIPVGRILYSLLTVVLSGQIIGLIAPKRAE